MRVVRAAILVGLFAGAVLGGACSHTIAVGREAPCGGARCAAGEYCCNASCGICAPVGTACIEIACGGPCDPQDVTADPACPTLRALGFSWNGVTCTLLSGCVCVGADCGALYPSLEACAADHDGCTPPPRPCIAASDCAPGELCDFPDDHMCGSSGTTGVCRPGALPCPGVVEPVCACDGRTHRSACEAEAAGLDVAFFGPCDPCAPEDAVPAAGGMCSTSLGRVWNGVACVDLVGCDCSGIDCATVLDPTNDCDARHAGCLDPMTFECPGDRACTRWAEMCVLGGPVGRASCEPLPADCPADPCACAMAAMCSDDGAGAVTLVR